MASKIKVYSPKIHRKGTTEEGVDVEYEEADDPFMIKSPQGPNSILQDAIEKPIELQTFRVKRGNTIITKAAIEEDFDESEVKFLFEKLGSMKKSSLLKNFTFEGLRDAEIREDYFMLLLFICLYGGEEFSIQDLKSKSPILSSLNYLNEKSNQILRRKEFISQVLIAAANQSEEFIVKEIIKNDSLGYIVSIQVVVAFVKANQHHLLKSLLKVVEQNKMSLYNVGTLTSLLPDHLSNKAALTSNNIPKRGKSLKGMDRPDENVSPRGKKKGGRGLEYGITMREVAGTVAQFAMRRPTIVDRELLPKSAYDNVIIEARFDTVFPYLIQMNRMNLVEPLIDYFGEKHINHLNLFIGFGQEELAMSHFKKFSWELTEGQLIMLLERRMWKFLCHISDDTQKMLFFTDATFTTISEMLQDGKILSEMVLLFMTLPIRGWRNNQVLNLMDLAKSLLNEDPDCSRLIYANNPILTCAQLSYLFKQLWPRFRFFQNELEALSIKLEKVSENLQRDSRENTLYALYLTPLPTGLTMLDYIIRMEMKGLVETKFTKALVLEFWNDESSVNGKAKHISFINHGAKVSKRFSWNIDLKPKLDYNYSFQFGNTMNSPKVLLMMDVFYLMIFYAAFDSYLYNKLNLFEKSILEPNFVSTLDPYKFDFGYGYYGAWTIAQLIFMFNLWAFLVYRVIHIVRQPVGKLTYKIGYIMTLIALSLTLLSLVMFPSYQSQNDNQLYIKGILVLTRVGLVYVILASMLGFQRSGKVITILSTVVVNLIPALGLLNIYMMFYGEIMYNFFYDYQLFDTYIESFLSMVEVLFGSLTFPNIEDVNNSMGEYYAINTTLTYFAFSSNIMATFLIIAYLSSILEAIKRDASYHNTLSQYYFLQMYSDVKNKGFYSFPPIISLASIPFYLISRIPQIKSEVNMLLLKIRFYLSWVPFQVFMYIVKTLFYYGPLLYFKNLYLITVGKMSFEGTRIAHLLAWTLVGLFVIIGYGIIDIFVLLKALTLNFEISMPQAKILLRSTDDNIIYIHRYGSLKDAINELMKRYPDQESFPYATLLAYLMSGGKDIKDHTKTLSMRKTRKAKEIFAELVREHIRKTSGSKWMKNIHAAKKKLFKEILDGFLSYKAVTMRPEDASIDPKLVLDLLNKIDDENVSYLRARHLSSIQMVLLNAQSKEQISIMNKIEELDRKVDMLGKMWSSQLPRVLKLPSILGTSQQVPTLLQGL